MSIIKYLFAAMLGAHAAFGQVPSDRTQRLAELVAKLEDGIPADMRYPEVAVDWPLWRNAPEFVELQRNLQDGWPQALQNVQQVAPTDTGKTILFLTARGLDREEYIKFLSSSVSLFRTGVIKDLRILKWALTPPDKRLSGFISANYSRADIRSMLEEAKAVFVSDKSSSHMVSLIDRILSGEAHRWYTGYIADMEATPPPRSLQGSDAGALEGGSHLSGNSGSKAAMPSNGQHSAHHTSRRSFGWVWAVGGIVTMVLVLGFAFRRRS